MAVAGSLVVNVVANAGKFVKGMNKASKRMKTFSSKAKDFAVGLGKFVAGSMAAAGTAIGVFVGVQAKAIDELSKFSQRIGIGIQDLKGFEIAAKRSGVEVSALRMGLQRMTRRVAEAAKGTGEAREAIKELGLDAETLAKMDPAEQFKSIADAMENIDSQGEKVRLAMRLFDSEGVALVNTLALGSEKINQLTEDAIAAGVAVDEFDAAGIERMNDTIDEAQELLSGAFTQALVQLAPYIEAAAEAMADFLKTGKLKNFVNDGLAFLIKGSAILASVWDVVAGAFKASLGIMLKGGQLFLKTFLIPVVEAAEWLANVFTDTDWTSGLKDAQEIIGNVSDDLISEGWDQLVSGFKGDAVTEAEAFLDSIKKKADEANKAAVEGAKKNAAAQNELNAALEEQNALVAEAGGLAPDDAVGEMVPALEEAKNAVVKGTENFKRLGDGITEFSDRVKALYKDQSDVVSDVIGRLVSDVREMRAEFSSLRRQINEARAVGVAGG